MEASRSWSPSCRRSLTCCRHDPADRHRHPPSGRSPGRPWCAAGRWPPPPAPAAGGGRRGGRRCSACCSLCRSPRKAVNELGLPLRYSEVIRQQAAEKHLDPALIAAVIYAETKFDARPSSAGAEGLMQILPQTARVPGPPLGRDHLHDRRPGPAPGQHRLRQLLPALPARRVPRQLVPALAAYNGGESNVDRWLAAVRRAGDRLPIADIPFPETRAYVQRVLQARRRLPPHLRLRSSATAERGAGRACRARRAASLR